MLRRRLGVALLHRLNNNENPLGPPLAAREVLARWNPRDAALYPQGDGWHLKRAIAGKVFRTFSKAWGLAGLRIGWMAASPAAAATVRKTSISYSVNLLALEAARAAVWDMDHRADTRAHARQGRDGLAAVAQGLGLAMVGGIGNFAMLRLPMPDTVAHRRLMARGLMARAMTSFRYPGWLRVSFGSAPAMAAFAKALEAVLAEG